MKKLFYSMIMCICTSVIVSAQGYLENVQWGIRGGLNVAHFGGDEGRDMGSKPAFHLGVIADYNVAENFYLQPGLYITGKGAKETDQGDKWIANPTYLEIPVLASYRINLSDDVEWQISAGPYFAVAIAGKYKYRDGTDSDFDYDFPLFTDDKKLGTSADFKRFDAGLSFGTGLVYNQLYFGLAYEAGLANISKETKYSAKNANFMLSVGYNF